MWEWVRKYSALTLTHNDEDAGSLAWAVSSESRNENFHHWEWNVHSGLEATKRLAEIILPFFAEKDSSSHLGKDGSQLCSGRLHPLTREPSGFKDWQLRWYVYRGQRLGEKGQDCAQSKISTLVWRLHLSPLNTVVLVGCI